MSQRLTKSAAIFLFALLSSCRSPNTQEGSLTADLILEGIVEPNGEYEYMFGDVGFVWYRYVLLTSGEQPRRVEFVSDHKICIGNAKPDQRYLVLLKRGAFYMERKRTQLLTAVRCLRSP